MLVVDHDAYITLAEIGVLDCLCNAFGEDHFPENIFRLRNAPNMVYDLAKSKRILEMAQDFLKNTSPLSILGCEKLHEELKGIPNVDEGEAEIFARVGADKNNFAVTGDIKSLTALCLTASDEVKEVLKGKVILTEQCLLKILDCQGFDGLFDADELLEIDHHFFSSWTFRMN